MFHFPVFKIITNTKYSNSRINPNGTTEIEFYPIEGTIEAVIIGPAQGRTTPSGPILQVRPTHHVIEIINPNGTVIKTRDETSGSSTLLYQLDPADVIPDGKWLVRVRNLERALTSYVVQVTYPVLLNVDSAPVQLLEAALKVVGFDKIKLHLQSSKKENNKRSWIDIGASILRQALEDSGVKLPIYFYLPQKEIEIDNAPDPVARINDISSNSLEIGFMNATSNLPNGSIQIRIQFEGKGIEVTLSDGYPDLDLKKINLTVDLGLAATRGLIGYNKIEANFPIDVDAQGVGGWLAEHLVHLTELVRDGVEPEMEKFLGKSSIRQFFEATLTGELKTRGLFGLRQNSQIREVKIINGQFIIKFINE